MDHAAAIKAKALELGFSKCGIISVEDVKGFSDRVDERVSAVPDSALMYNRFRYLADVQREFDWARSVVVLVFNYGRYKIPEQVRDHIGTAYLFDGRKDKLSEAKRMADELQKFIEGLGIQVGRNDEGFTALRYAAAAAGLGRIRRNNFFYTDEGSWNAINVFAIDKDLELKGKEIPEECPADCNKCIGACPTGSLYAPFCMNPMKCVSFLTSIGAGMFNLVRNPEADKFKGWVYGCDDCQKACPFNNGRFIEKEKFPGVDEIADSLSLEKIIDMDEEFYKNVVQPKFWYLEEDMMWVWKVNALNAMKNDYREEYAPLIKKCLNDPNERVNAMAERVCKAKKI